MMQHDRHTLQASLAIVIIIAIVAIVYVHGVGRVAESLSYRIETPEPPVQGPDWEGATLSCFAHVVELESELVEAYRLLVEERNRNIREALRLRCEDVRTQ